MKELESKNPDRDQIHHQREARKENKMIGSFKPKRGHKMYKFCDGVLSELNDSDYFDAEVQIKERPPIGWYESVDKDGNRVRPGNRNIRKIEKDDEKSYTKMVRKIRMDANTYYFSALNIDNAKKHCLKNRMKVQIINV